MLKSFFLIKLQALPEALLKKRLQHWCFLVSFPKFLRTFFLKKTAGLLFLKVNDRDWFGITEY